MKTLISVRKLQKGEDALWHHCTYSPDSNKISDKPPFTNDSSFRSETHLIAEQEGRVVGKMEWILGEPHEAILVDPIVVPDASVEEVAHALLFEGLRIARSFKVHTIQVILQDRLPYLSELIPLMEVWKFRPLWQKNLYTLNPKDFPAHPDSPMWKDLEFLPFGGLDDRLFRETLDVILQDVSLDRQDEGCNAATMLEILIDECRGNKIYYPEDWELALIGKEPVWVVLPAYMNDQRDSASNLFVGLVPKMRGQGLGRLLHFRGMETISKRGVRNYLSSCDCLNLPMIKIFESLNYRLLGIQHYFEPSPV